MFNKLSLRMRITLTSTLLLLVCSLGLTTLLNYAANNMADVIEASPLMPAMPYSESNNSELNNPNFNPLIPVEASSSARFHFLYQSIGYMCLIVISGGWLTWFLTGKSISNLHTLTTQIKNRTVHNLSEQIPVPESNDEIAILTASFNEMSGKLEDAFNTQRRFSQSAAHELRTPLTVLRTKIDVFNKKASPTQDDYNSLINAFSKQVDRLSSLVSALLNLTNLEKIESKSMVNISEVFDSIKDELKPLADSYEVTINSFKSNIVVKANPLLFHRAIYNLVENGIKYNNKSGSVTLEVIEMDTGININIIDTGNGIDNYEKTLIFEPFYRVDKSRSRMLGGAGLGLSTTKAIIEKQGGKIFVCDNKNGGSIFTIYLPK